MLRYRMKMKWNIQMRFVGQRIQLIEIYRL